MKNKKLTPFKTKIAKGLLIPIVAAGAPSGYSVQHLRRLCRNKIVAHVRRGSHIYFTPEQLDALTVNVKPRRVVAAHNRRGAYR